MTAKQIFHALQECDGASRAQRDAAKAGFLEWAMTLPSASSARREARLALFHLDAMSAHCDAAHLFIGYLRAASEVLPTPVRRGGASARRRVLH